MVKGEVLFMKGISFFLEKLQANEFIFWIGGLVGLLIIFIGQYGIKRIFKKNIENKRKQLFVNTIINWLSLFIIVIYFFTYFLKTPFIYKTLFVFGDSDISIILILSIIFSLVLAVKISRAVREFILPIVYEKYDLDIGVRASMNTFFNYLIVTLTVIISLSSLGFNLSSLTVFASILGVGIGFGLQNLMSNFISGLIILFERPIRVGDRIIVNNKIANVEEIKIRATIVRTRENERMIIPNSYFLEEKFINRSYSDKRLRISVKVQVAYASDVDLVEKILYKSVYELKNESWPNIVNEPRPRVFFEDFGESGLDFSVWFWINSQLDEREFRIPSDLRFKIIKKFSENKIDIPFPQRDINIRSENKGG